MSEGTVGSWTAAEVAQWLSDEGFSEEWGAAFAQNEIDGEALKLLKVSTRPLAEEPGPGQQVPPRNARSPSDGTCPGRRPQAPARWAAGMRASTHARGSPGAAPRALIVWRGAQDPALLNDMGVPKAVGARLKFWCVPSALRVPAAPALGAATAPDGAQNEETRCSADARAGKSWTR